MQTRRPDEGPSETGIPVPGTGGRPVVRGSSAKERYDPKLLRSLAKKHNIDTTKSLVAAYNVTTNEDERAVLLGWLRKYHDRREDCLTPEAALEYAELSNVVQRSTSEKGIVKDLIRDLSSCICEGSFLAPNLAAALYTALVHVDPSAHGGAVQLVVVARRLLGSLTREPKLTKGNFAEHESTFLALQQTFFLLRKANQNDIDEEEKQELRRTVAEKERTMKLSCKHYPVNFHFKALRQAVERLKDEDAASRDAQTKQCLMCGLCGFVHVLQFLRNLARGDIDPTALGDAYERNRVAIDNMGVAKKPWFDRFRSLMAKRLELLKDETKLGLFVSEFDAAMESQQEMVKGEDLKALRFGIIQELRLSARQTASETARREVATKLLMLSTSRAVFEEWFDDADIFTAFLDALHEIHLTSHDSQQTTEAFQQMQQSCKGHARSTLRAWLVDDVTADRIEMRDQQESHAERNKVFVEIARDVGHVPLDTIRSNISDLKEKYKHDSFAKVSSHSNRSYIDRIRHMFVSKVTSLFGTEVGYHVREMEHYVVAYEEIVERTATERREDRVKKREVEDASTQEKDHPREHYEQKKKVTKPISLGELFKPRSLKPGDPESEIRKVLLYGNPGSGKTCISKAIAHTWSLGELMQDFEAVYVVPIRRVNVAKSKCQQGVTLKDVVAQTCFGERNNVEYEDLLAQVEGDLDLPTTLLIFDGLDEAGEDARELVYEAEKHLCKLLILTRPYNLRQIRAKVECQFECLGFNDRQLKNYVNRELQQNEASRLIHSLQQDPGMWETAHTPVAAHILCSLSKQHGTSIENRVKRASMFQIYGDMTNYVWERFKGKPEARMINKDVVFGDLEKIAFEALRSGQILIEERIVKSHATSTNTTGIFKESGFLLFVLEGQQYQFPHLTFQEYFAGRFIAKSLKRNGSDEEGRVLKFIQEGKYCQRNALTLSFATHALAQKQSKFALRKMLSVVDEKPVEVLGIQHLFLKMRVLNATIELSDEIESITREIRLQIFYVYNASIPSI